MPAWAYPVAVMLIGQALMIWLNIHLLTARLDARDLRWKDRDDEVDRRLEHVEVHKLSTDIHVLAIDGLTKEVSQVRHRVGAIEQREIARAEHR